MNIKKTEILGLFIIEPSPFKDNRGSFYRVYCQNELEKVGIYKKIVQINQSFNKNKGTIRGLHFQYPPKAEIKFLKCLRGSIFDVAVDIRKDSPTFLKYHSEILSDKNLRIMVIPEGFAHGFQTLEDNCEVLYLHTEFYSKELEAGLRYDDKRLNINWPLNISHISERDMNHPIIDNNFKGIII